MSKYDLISAAIYDAKRDLHFLRKGRADGWRIQAVEQRIARMQAQLEA